MTTRSRDLRLPAHDLRTLAPCRAVVEERNIMACVVLVEQSLATTLANLEEARIGGLPREHHTVLQALNWVASRVRGPRAYRGVLFAPTPLDYLVKLPLPTGENAARSGAGVSHCLGEEAVRALSFWKHREGWDAESTLAAVMEWGRDDPRAGWFCCGACSVARWRALSAARPDGWEEIVSSGLRTLGDMPLTPDGRWPLVPFYHTLLALGEIPLPEAEAQRKRARPRVERLLRREPGDSRAGRVRRRALESALR